MKKPRLIALIILASLTAYPLKPEGGKTATSAKTVKRIVKKTIKLEDLIFAIENDDAETYAAGVGEPNSRELLIKVLKKLAARNKTVVIEQELKPDDSSGEKDPVTKYKEDSKKILSLVSEIRIYRELEDDTEIQKEMKRKKLKRALARLNKKLKGKNIALNAVEIREIQSKRYGYLITCFFPPPKESKCRYYGVLIKENDEGCETLVGTRILIVEKSREKAFRLKKNEVIPVVGRIGRIDYNGRGGTWERLGITIISAH